MRLNRSSLAIVPMASRRAYSAPASIRYWTMDCAEILSASSSIVFPSESMAVHIRPDIIEH